MDLIQQWRLWDRATGSRTPEGKARVAQNAWKSGQWAELRQLFKAVKAELLAMERSLPL